jgi:ATP-binding protein involved in chromosome partitioning
MSSSEGAQCGHGQQQQEEDNARIQDQLSRISHKLLVMSGKGGVGKSSVAAYLALSLAKLGRKVGLLDVDLHGPSIPRMLGLEGIFSFTPEKRMIPHAYNERLHVISIDCLLQDRDSAVIWRGPIKHGVIKQFISDVEWGNLDFLVIDSPPGTGDEPLSVAQTIPDAKAIVVTTPQEIALADVRKSINFCKQVNLPILGIVENMSGFICPHCNTETPLLGKGGGLRTAKQMDIDFLGSLPFDPRMVEASDLGKPLLENPDSSPLLNALERFTAEVIDRCGTSGAFLKMFSGGGCPK